MHDHTDVQRETIIPCHYRVVGYKKIKKTKYISKKKKNVYMEVWAKPKQTGDSTLFMHELHSNPHSKFLQ